MGKASFYWKLVVEEWTQQPQSCMLLGETSVVIGFAVWKCFFWGEELG